MNRRACREPAAPRRLAIAAAACLLCAAGWGAARADSPPLTASDQSLPDRAATLAGQVCDIVREQIVEPARRATDAALASPIVEQAYRQVAEAMQSVATTVDENAVQPIGRAASDLLDSPAADEARAFAGTVWDDTVAGVHRYIVAPLSGLVAAPEGGASLEKRDGTMAAAVEPPRLAAAADGLSDPFEPVNRQIFALNSGLRFHLLEPATRFYRGETPAAVQDSVQNFFANLREPITIASSLLEGEIDDAGNATARFGINTTVGIVGLFDPATAYGFPPRRHNLEEALCVYRLPPGPYIVLPLYGPATLRDAVGRLATVFAYFEAMGFGVYVPYRVGDAVAQAAGSRQPGAVAEALSPDPYTAQKLLYVAARDVGCGRYVRNGSDKLSP